MNTLKKTVDFSNLINNNNHKNIVDTKMFLASLQPLSPLRK